MSRFLWFTVYISLFSGGILTKTGHKYSREQSTRERELLEMFSRSWVIGQGHAATTSEYCDFDSS